MHERAISVIGLGYVGLPIAVAFGKDSRVIGFDVNAKRVGELKQGIDASHEVTGAELKSAAIFFTTEAKEISAADFHIIAVPTPINAAKQPDLAALLCASSLVGERLKKGDIVVYESTVYPGATEEDCLPVLEKVSGLKSGVDFFVGYSPERINPGDQEHTFTRNNKIVSAQDQKTLAIIAEVYGSVIDADIHCAPSIKVAEAAKVIENTQRDLNIALMNELALVFETLDIDTEEVLKAAKTKWNFLPFTPGLVGGHCIGVDPYYLTYRAARAGYSPGMILAGRRINDGMGKVIATRVIKALLQAGNISADTVVTILGFTFKENVADTRNTRVIDIVHELQDHGFSVQVHDPLADKNVVMEDYGIKLKAFSDLRPTQAVVLAVPHAVYVKDAWERISALIGNKQGVVFDVKSILNKEAVPDNINLQRL